MLSQYPRSAFQGFCGGHREGQQQFATQTLRVHLLGIDLSLDLAFEGLFLPPASREGEVVINYHSVLNGCLWCLLASGPDGCCSLGWRWGQRDTSSVCHRSTPLKLLHGLLLFWRSSKELPKVIFPGFVQVISGLQECLRVGRVQSYGHLVHWQEWVLGSVLRLRLRPPPPTPEFLSKNFCLQPGLQWKVLLRRTWSGQKLLPLQFPGLSPHPTKGNQVSSEGFTSPTQNHMENRQALGSGVESGPDVHVILHWRWLKKNYLRILLEPGCFAEPCQLWRGTSSTTRKVLPLPRQGHPEVGAGAGGSNSWRDSARLEKSSEIRKGGAQEQGPWRLRALESTLRTIASKLTPSSKHRRVKSTSDQDPPPKGVSLEHLRFVYGISTLQAHIQAKVVHLSTIILKRRLAVGQPTG